jgi:hypothetical protein
MKRDTGLMRIKTILLVPLQINWCSILINCCHSRESGNPEKREMDSRVRGNDRLEFFWSLFYLFLYLVFVKKTAMKLYWLLMSNLLTYVIFI